MEKQNPTQHSMTRRSAAHDYTRPGIYHITLHVADDLGHPLGAVVGNLSAPDGSADAPRIALSPLGQMVEHELLHAITAHYPMITIQDHIVMPEHIHFLMVVQDKILSRNGTTMHLGQVIAGFKKGCNRRFWEMTGQTAGYCDGKTAAHTAPIISPAPAGIISPAPAGILSPDSSGIISPNSAGILSPSGIISPNPSGILSPSGIISPNPSGILSPAPFAVSVPGGFPAGYKVPSSARSGNHPLFDPGYCDVMPVDAEQLATQRQYIAANPRCRLLRQQLHLRLLLSPDGSITCDTFGDRALLARRLLPVVCHRKDASRFAAHRSRCLAEAARGSVLISARIAKGEQAIIDEALRRGFPVALITDNGFPDRYHPSQDRLRLCADGHLLLITPWQYHYQPEDASISVPTCKAMNCLAQALARQKDTWWQQQ